jgi:metal-sulfur cluster biosynthetic enzyme
VTARTADELREDVLQSLRMVIDPELGESLVDLGLIYRVETGADGTARIAMSTTTRGCPAASFLKEAVHSAAALVPGITQVDVVLTYEPPWSPEMIGAAVRHKFGMGGRADG